MVHESSAVDDYLDRFFSKINVPFSGDVLDLGCGDGRIAERIARTSRRVCAVDLEPRPEWGAYSVSNLGFSTGDAEDLAFPDHSFDMVLAVNMLHHTSNPARAIDEIHRVCRPGGTMIIVEPNRFNPLGYLHLTLLGNHDHFTTSRFLNLTGAPADQKQVVQFECHCWPAPSGVRKLLERVEDFLDRAGFWKPFLFYNVVIARR